MGESVLCVSWKSYFGEVDNRPQIMRMQLLLFCTEKVKYFLFSGLKKWVEIGNSGVFRPEMLIPMGLPKDVSVIAWGLSLERYDINNSTALLN